MCESINTTKGHRVTIKLRKIFVDYTNSLESIALLRKRVPIAWQQFGIFGHKPRTWYRRKQNTLYFIA